MIDMLSYVDVFWEVFVVWEEVLGWWGYFGYFYIDLVIFYECVGWVEGRNGFII